MCAPNCKNCEETFVQTDVDASKRSPITQSGIKQVVAGRNLNTPGHIMKTEYADNKTHVFRGRSSANTTIADSAKVHVFAPIQSPPGHILKTENETCKTQHI